MNFINDVNKEQNNKTFIQSPEDKAILISQSIREAKWLHVCYKNKKQEFTSFWCDIQDVDYKNRTFTVSMFNFELKNKNKWPLLINKSLNFDAIQNLAIIPNTCYEVPEELQKKIENSTELAKWLRYDEFDNNILFYLRDCVLFNVNPTINAYTMLPSLDHSDFKEGKPLLLSDEQCAILSNSVNEWFKKQRNKKNITLAFNYLSIIKNNNSIFPIVYKKVMFNPETKTLCMDKKYSFTKGFLMDQDDQEKIRIGHSIIDISPDDFINGFSEHVKEYESIIINNLWSNEKIDTNPRFYEIMIEHTFDITPVCNSIAKLDQEKKLPAPLKAFLGCSQGRGGKRSEPLIVTYDDKVNIDQMRVIFNAMREKITYVMGPPGTGKTQTILNIIINAFFNDKSCLICSNNNYPIKEIIDKCKSVFNDVIKMEIMFPFLRVGNKEEEKKTILQIKEMFEQAKKNNEYDEITTQQKDNVANRCRELSELLTKYEDREELVEKEEILCKWKTNIKNNELLSSYLTNEINDVEKKLSKNKDYTDEQIKQLCQIDHYSFNNYLRYHSLALIKKLESNEYTDFIDILNENNSDIAVQKFEEYIVDDSKLKKLIKVFPFFVVTNISAKKIGSPIPHFDICIMDESSQCDIAQSLNPIIRAERLVLVGDTNQLRPVIVLDPIRNKELQEKYQIKNKDIYNYLTQSVLSLMEGADKNSKRVMLRYHYRCPKKIIKFSNGAYYENRLKLVNEEEGKVNLVDVHNVNSPRSNSWEEEANAVVAIVKKDCDKENTAIISPFRNQVYLIKEKLENEGIKNVKVGTIHTVQGAEYDKIIIAPGIGAQTKRQTFNWIKKEDPLINVAVTRAKKELTLVVDSNKIDELSGSENNQLQNLVNYIKKDGNVSTSSFKPVRNDLSNNSQNEKVFFETINQVFSRGQKMTIKHNEPMMNVFSISEIQEFDSYYRNSEFDIVVYERKFNKDVPVLIIELDGGEHFAESRTMKNDQKKSEICRRKEIKLLRVPNNFAAHYEYIKDVINIISTDSGQQMLGNTYL